MGYRLAVFDYFQSYRPFSTHKISQRRLTCKVKKSEVPWLKSRWGTGALHSVGFLDHPEQCLLVAWRYPLAPLVILESRLTTTILSHFQSLSCLRAFDCTLHIVGLQALLTSEDGKKLESLPCQLGLQSHASTTESLFLSPRVFKCLIREEFCLIGFRCSSLTYHYLQKKKVVREVVKP